MPDNFHDHSRIYSSIRYLCYNAWPKVVEAEVGDIGILTHVSDQSVAMIDFPSRLLKH